jgi:hypothetical protein
MAPDTEPLLWRAWLSVHAEGHTAPGRAKRKETAVVANGDTPCGVVPCAGLESSEWIGCQEPWIGHAVMAEAG